MGQNLSRIWEFGNIKERLFVYDRPKNRAIFTIRNSPNRMPQHKSAAKRVRQSERRRLRNRKHHSKVRTLIKKLQLENDREKATVLLKEVKATLDRMATKNLIHKNKAAHYKSRLERKVNAMS